MSYETILTETVGTGPLKTGVIRLNRPKQMNALSDQLMDELGAALLAFDADDAIGAIVLTGNERAFAAGADISIMAKYDYMDAFKKGHISRNWETMRQVRKPVIAAVAGFALGGGCEVAMMCDMLIAADTASPRSSWASCRAPAARSACRAPSARPRRWTWCSPAA
jgi:enoyl-CoA hydratase